MRTLDEEPDGRRLALIVATAAYEDATLAQLRAPGRDATVLAQVLGDAAVGGFEVETLLDASADALRRRIARFCAVGGPRDLALVYLSCHGVLDDRGRLYYAASDTDRALLAATAIPAAWLNDQLEDSRCRRQVLILDCCHSGAFAKGAKGEGGLALRERFEGRGRIVLTASRGTEYSFEDDRVLGDGVSSVFTGALVDGLRSGDADRDRDGLVTLSELYDYAYEAVRARGGCQTPTLWTYGAEGGLVLAHSPRGAVVEPAPLPEDLSALLESPRARVREGAVVELGDVLASGDPGRALTARAQLERIAAEDLPAVAAAARRALAAAPPAESPPAIPVRPAPTDPATPPRRPRGRPRPLVPAAVALAVAVAVAAVAVLPADRGPAPRSVPPGAIAVNGQPRGVAVDGGAIWVARHDDGKVDRIDPTAPTEAIDVGRGADQIVAGEGSVWVSVRDGTRLVRIDPRTHKVAQRVPVNVGKPCSDCNTPELVIADGSLFVASVADGTITRHDLRTGEPDTDSFELGPGFNGQFAIAQGAIWAIGKEPDGDERAWLIRIDLDSGDPKPPYYFQADSFFAGVTYSAGLVFVADAGDAHDEIMRFTPRTEKTSTVKVAVGITGNGIAATNDAILVWQPDDGVLTKVDLATFEPRSTHEVRDYRRGQAANKRWSELALGSGSAWVSDPTGDLLTKIDY